MANLIPAVAHGIEVLRLYLARELARRALLKRSDRGLDDIGLSRELLEQGAGAWPWRRDDEADAIPAVRIARPTNRLRLRRAFLELYALDDRQLANMGLSRDGIAEALRQDKLNAEVANA